MANETAEETKKGCGKTAGIGCLAVLVLLAAGGFFAYRQAKHFLKTALAEYADTKPAALPVVQMPAPEQTALFQRVNAFAKAVKEGRRTPELVLTDREINVLIQKSPAWSNKVSVVIEDDHLNGEASIPLGELGGPFTGHWINGRAGFRVATAAGRLVVFLDSLSVRGKPVPPPFMEAVRSRNLAERAMQDPKAAAVLKKLDSVAVQDGTLVIKAK